MSIALSLIELAAREAHVHQASRVQTVHIRLGPLAGVAREALEFSFEIAAEGTTLAGARLMIEHVPVVVYCRRCQAECAVAENGPLYCSGCGSPALDLRHGNELELTALEIE